MPAATYKRERTTSRHEESNVQSFIDSCVNFTTNVSFHTAKEGAQLAQEVQQHSPTQHAVLLLGAAAALSNMQTVSAAFPYAASTPGLEAAIRAAGVDKAHVALVTESSARVLIGKVPDTASRHNCPMRPDSLNKIIAGAVGETPADGGLDIYVVGSGFELCIATAVARASNRSFSAKSGRAEKAYMNTGIPVRVVMEGVKDVAALKTIATSVQLCQRLVDAPTNLLDTTTFTEIASSFAHKLKVEKGVDVAVDILQGDELREKGYGGLYGTGKAAEFPPHLVTLSYKPKAGIAPRDKIALVGKGIVYDTGGLAIKGRDNMCTMKHDMGGAAAIFAGFLAIAQLGAPVELSCILCLADNAIGPRAQRNDDIIRMKSGRTVEINNTDAEGRLVLSDGVYHASAELPYKPSLIIDMATLTGAQGVATGKYHAAIYANTEEAEQTFLAAGRRCGDLCFPVVYCPELHNTEFRSAVADYRNSVANRSNAQVSCAAQFIGNNLVMDYKGDWVHVDLTGPATYDQATGFGVSLLVQVVAQEYF